MPERIYHGSVRALSVVMIGLGVVVVVLTLANGGGLLSVGLLIGVAFLAVGIARLYLASRIQK